MIPEKDKWYMIKYGKITSKRGYHGPALCIGSDPFEKDAYSFVEPACQHLPHWRYSMLFKAKDIKYECEPVPSYLDLMDSYDTVLKTEMDLYRKYLERQ